MIQEDPCKIKFEKLHPWTSEIFQVIKKDLRIEHLLKSPAFVQKYFPKRPLDKLTTEEFSNAYSQEIAEGNEELGQKVITHWVMKHADLYELFATELGKINAQFDEIESLPADVSAFLFQSAVVKFGATATYIFCVMNAVVFTEEQFGQLRGLALKEKENIVDVEKPTFKSVESLQEHYETQMRKMHEKQEKKLQGLERKYHQDMEGFKKQIAQLHKKLQGSCV